MIDAGYVIYDAAVNGSERFEFDKSVGGRGSAPVSTTHENNRLELKTFGRVPYVYYAGDTDYAKFNLVGTFHYNDETMETARQQVDRLKALINSRKTITVENSQGEVFLCDVNMVGESAPRLYVEKDMDYIDVTIECTQIDF